MRGGKVVWSLFGKLYMASFSVGPCAQVVYTCCELGLWPGAHPWWDVLSNGWHRSVVRAPAGLCQHGKCLSRREKPHL